MAEVTLSAGIRSNLVSLQNTNRLLSQTQERLSTGKAVNSAIDNPKNFFAAANLDDRSTQLQARLDGMGQAVSTLQASDNALSAMRGIVGALKSVVEQALSQVDSNDRAASGRQFNELLVQLSNLAKDSGYQGVNLLRSGESNMTAGRNEILTVQFHERYNQSTLDIKGVNVRAAELPDAELLDINEEFSAPARMSGANGQFWAVSFNDADQPTGSAIGLRSANVTAPAQTDGISANGTAHEITWVDDNFYRENLRSVTEDIERFDQALVNTAKGISQNVNIVTLRQDFTTELVNILDEGSDKLTLADLNEEGANLLALQTAQQLGTQSLAIASQANQAVLSLLG